MPDPHAPELTGEELYRRLLEGDRDVLVELIELYRAGLMLFLLGIVKDPHDAEELVIDTFVALVKNPARFHGESPLKTYLFGIGRNLARRRLKTRKQDVSLEEIRELAGENAELETVYRRMESKRRLYDAMRGLKGGQRAVLYLLYFENMSYADIGMILGKTQTQIASIAYRARQALKSRLESEGLTCEDF